MGCPANPRPHFSNSPGMPLAFGRPSCSSSSAGHGPNRLPPPYPGGFHSAGRRQEGRTSRPQPTCPPVSTVTSLLCVTVTLKFRFCSRIIHQGGGEHVNFHLPPPGRDVCPFHSHLIGQNHPGPRPSGRVRAGAGERLEYLVSIAESATIFLLSL